MSLRSPFGRVKGLGAAHEGVHHWWAQRLSALALIPLTVWFVVSLVSLSGADYATVRAWMGSPVVAGLLILLIVTVFYHAALGLQVVIEDYVHTEATKIAALLAVKAAAAVLALSGVLAVLDVLFGA
ncbi:MAG: succinate dehydrogenase, hydrophobic membrane anchor protein [Alphaproteobacteria bacterium]|nr:MAG: succinate dehydrogenase, hydrophobic membrane anchor protein [Alphaproteobacteria bacterium]